MKTYNSYEFADLYLLFIPWHFPLHNNLNITGASIDAEKELENQYPAIYKHLLKHKGELSNRNKAETGIRYEWYALQRWGANYWDDFSKQKIVWKRVGSILRFSFDETGVMALDSTCFATGKYIKFLVAVLNSKMGHYLMRDAPQTGTGDLLISVQAIEPLRIPIPDINTEKSIERILDIILNRINCGQSYHELELELNKMIYAMYNLDRDEINFIDGESVT
ncbi:hypothetical protein [Olivibacter sitiensis]|uniref:hypothetical protein n=1 Tax=Olivibacter sitiensis TaxID=376470 RepID=UPI0004178E51|nr:hypothetical protein [Olivibacter sitiensis]